MATWSNKTVAREDGQTINAGEDLSAALRAEFDTDHMTVWYKLGQRYGWWTGGAGAAEGSCGPEHVPEFARRALGDDGDDHGPGCAD